MTTLFEARAVRGTRKARVSFVGPSGSGKTKSALRFAEGLLPDGMKIALLDTEHRSSELYAEEHEFYPAYMAAPYSPQRYIKVIQEAAGRGDIGVFIIDSLSHAWMGSGGVLEQVDQISGERNDNRNAWKKMTPVQQELVESIIGAPFHVIVTLRTKDAYGMNEKNQRVKVGLAPVQRDGLDYEFDVVFYLNQEHTATVDKSRVSEIFPVGTTLDLPGPEPAHALGTWLASGAAPPAEPEPEPAPPAAAADQPAAAEPASGDPFGEASPPPITSDAPAASSEATAQSAGDPAVSSPEAAAPASADTTPDPFGETTASQDTAGGPDEMLKTMRQLIESKRNQLVKLTQAANADRGHDYWVKKIADRCQEWYGKELKRLTPDELADLSQKLELTRLAMIREQEKAAAEKAAAS